MTRKSAAFNSLVKLFSANLEQKVLYETVEMVKKAQFEGKFAIWERLDYLGNVLIQRFQVVPGNQMSFAGLCAAGEFSLSLFGLDLGPKFPFETIVLQQKQGVLFLLYTHFTTDSFVDFPCGHFALKYEYYRLLQGQLGSRAASYGDFRAMNILCWCCQSDVSEAIARSCAGELPLPRGFTGNYTAICDFCTCNYEVKLPGLCPNHSICPICAIKNYTTATFDVNRCCQTQRSDSDLFVFRNAMERQFSEYLPMLEMVKHDKRVAFFKQFVVICAACKEEYVFDKFQDICEKCRILANPKPRQRQPLCPVCLKNPLTSPADTKCDICQNMQKLGITTQGEKPAVAADRVRSRQLAFPGKPSTADTALNWTGSSFQEDYPAVSRANSTQEQQAVSLRGPDRREGNWFDESSHRVKRTDGSEERKKRTESDTKGRVKVDIPKDPESAVSQPGRHGKPSKCMTCQAQYSREDEAYFCPGACRCRRCAVEALVDAFSSGKCRFCQNPFQQEVLRAANMGRKRCHVCGIAVDKAEMAPHTTCSICIKCVVLSDERELWVIPTIKGKCRLHPKTVFPIDTQYYKTVRERDPHSACCSFEYTEGKVLKCGHTVCGTHQKSLLFCRACQAPAELLYRHQT